MSKKLAFITGASRGIGKATALKLAREGFNIVITARTASAGDSHHDMLTTADGKPLAGSLEQTLSEIQALGAEVLAVKMDLLDEPSITAAVDQAVSHFGRIDVLINNATFHGDNLNALFADIDVNNMQRIFQANVYGPFHLTQLIVKQMLKNGGGTVISLTTGGAEMDPHLAADKGGWGFNYAASKAAFHRLAGILNIEHGKQGIKAFNLQPGVVATESLLATLGGDGALVKQYGCAPPELPATVIHWLLSSPEADDCLGETVNAQRLAKKWQLAPE